MSINNSRVLIGGLVAGLIINVGEFLLNEPILGDQWRAAFESLGQPPMGGGSIALYVVLGFLLGIAAVYLYAAIRPRFGAGPKTAVCAGLLVWFFSYFYVNAGMMGMDLFPKNLIIISVVWGIVEVTLATVAGAALYKE
jgi:hypothetical protein